MPWSDILQWLNILGIPILAYVVQIEKRVVRLEIFHEVSKDDFYRRKGDALQGKRN